MFSVVGREKLRFLRLHEITYRLRELELTEKIVRELDLRIRHVVSGDPAAKGPYTALFLSSALDDVSRFPDSKHACAYVGLVPSLHQSGSVSYSGHITRQGNKWLRRNLVECARWTVRKDPHMKAFYERVKHRKGKKRALVAVARKIVSYAFWMLKRNLTYVELAPWKSDWGCSSDLE